jgi:DNA polymerase
MTTPQALGKASSLEEARREAAGCRACGLWRLGTQTVFGAGSDDARLLVVGEQPGDQEDLQGEPFVGPAGRLLGEALAEAGIDRESAYLTNAVKHFKWRPKGNRRIHDTPSWSEVKACLPWLELELALVRPEVVVLLGATAAQALLGREFRVTRQRGRVRDAPFAQPLVATVHPSSVLRAPREKRKRERAAFVTDRGVGAALRAARGGGGGPRGGGGPTTVAPSGARRPR